MTPLVGLYIGLALVTMARLCYWWGFRRGFREGQASAIPKQFLGMPLVINPLMPTGEVQIRNSRTGELQGKITGIDTL